KAPSGNANSISEAADEHWYFNICSAPVAEFSIEVGAPTTYGAILVDLAGVFRPGGDSHRRVVENGLGHEACPRRGMTGCADEQRHESGTQKNSEAAHFHNYISCVLLELWPNDTSCRP